MFSQEWTNKIVVYRLKRKHTPSCLLTNGFDYYIDNILVVVHSVPMYVLFGFLLFCSHVFWYVNIHPLAYL